MLCLTLRPRSDPAPAPAPAMTLPRRCPRDEYQDLELSSFNKLHNSAYNLVLSERGLFSVHAAWSAVYPLSCAPHASLLGLLPSTTPARCSQPPQLEHAPRATHVRSRLPLAGAWVKLGLRV